MRTHMHIHPLTIATCRNRLARRKSLPTYPLQTMLKSAPSGSDTMMMTLPWQHTPWVSCSSGVGALNNLDSIFKWWRPFENKVSAGSHSTSCCSAESNGRLTDNSPEIGVDYHTIKKREKLSLNRHTCNESETGPFLECLPAEIWSLLFFRRTYINYSF